MTIYIITWRYHGEAGSGVVGAYASEKSAFHIMKLLEGHGDMSKIFEMTTAEDVEVKKEL